MNKHTEELEKAREGAWDAYGAASWSTYNQAYSASDSICWSVSELAYYTTYLARKADSSQLNYQINKVLEVL